MSNILKFIELIRGTTVDHIPGLDPNDTSYFIVGEIFTQGNCGNFAQALQLAFGGEVVYIGLYHHYCLLLDGKLYDINGDVSAMYLSWSTPNPTHLEDCTGNYSFAERGPIM